MKVLISGASGLIGQELISHFRKLGYEAIALKRSSDLSEAPCWNPSTREIHLGDWQSCDALIHLSGENIAGGLWSSARKQRFLNSRVETSKFLAEHFSKSLEKPKVIISASGISYYGDRGDDVLTESSPLGQGFLAGICRAWENAWQPAEDAAIRCVFMRLGIVLSPKGGALVKMLPAFRLGVGGRLGSGRQYMPWIALEDVVNAVSSILDSEGISGPVNLSAPKPVTNRDFTELLSAQLNRPAFLPVPEFILRNLPGGMGKELFLASLNARPEKLLQAGYEFRFESLKDYFEQTLSK